MASFFGEGSVEPHQQIIPYLLLYNLILRRDVIITYLVDPLLLVLPIHHEVEMGKWVALSAYITMMRHVHNFNALEKSL